MACTDAFCSRVHNHPDSKVSDRFSRRFPLCILRKSAENMLQQVDIVSCKVIDEYAHDDDQGQEYEGHDNMEGLTLEAHLAREAARFNARKRPRSQPPPGQNARARTEAGHRAYLEQQLEKSQGGRGSSTREHQQR